MSHPSLSRHYAARRVQFRRNIQIVPEKIRYIGKESNRLEEIEIELEHCIDDVLQVYKEPASDGLLLWRLEALKENPVARAGRNRRGQRAINSSN